MPGETIGSVKASRHPEGQVACAHTGRLSRAIWQGKDVHKTKADPLPVPEHWGARRC